MYNSKSLVVLVLDGEDDLEVWVILNKGGFKVFVQIRVEALEGPYNRYTWDRLLMTRRKWRPGFVGVCLPPTITLAL